MPNISVEMQQLASYIAEGPSGDVEVVEKAQIHIVDTVAAMLSGASLGPGQRAAEYVRLQGRGECTVVRAGFRAGVVDAALANGMAAHADETDDSHAPSVSHPGCAVVPAALAVGEQLNSSGRAVLEAVVAGYDVGTRVVLALGEPHLRTDASGHSTHALVSLFGAAAAAARLFGVDEAGARYVLSYAAQSASGITSWLRDVNHVEKAFVFGGMPAANGVRAAAMVASGCDGVDDVFSSQPNFLDAFSSSPSRAELTAELGSRFEIMRTNIKKFAVGSPAQAAIQAVLDILADGPVDHRDVQDIEIVLPADLARVVDARDMANINVQYLVVGTLLDGGFSFAMAHDDARLQDATVRGLLGRTRLVADPTVSRVRCATVTMTTTDGQQRRQHVAAVRGTVDDPMTRAEVHDKAVDLMTSPLGEDRTQQLLSLLWDMPSVGSVRELRPLLE